MNNGFASNYFTIERGVRQGDPFSPLLFILRSEVPACSIRQNENIQGIKTGKEEEVKVALFVDDLSCFVKKACSYEQLASSLENFAAVSGVKVNSEKTEFFCVGLKKLDFFPREFKTSLKILGVRFSYNQLLRKKDNFEGILKFVKKTLTMWKWRGLTLGENSNSQVFRHSKIYVKSSSYLCFQGSYSSCKQRIVRFHLEWQRQS